MTSAWVSFWGPKNWSSRPDFSWFVLCLFVLYVWKKGIMTVTAHVDQQLFSVTTSHKISQKSTWRLLRPLRYMYVDFGFMWSLSVSPNVIFKIAKVFQNARPFFSNRSNNFGDRISFRRNDHNFLVFLQSLPSSTAVSTHSLPELAKANFVSLMK